MSELLSSAPLYQPAPYYGTKATKDKGTQIMKGLLLDQYQNSPDLQEYYLCFIAELDYLFEQIEEVYLGRHIEGAVGVQLEIIGEILQQPKAVALPSQWFGFQGAVDVEGMADEAMPAEGGLFRDENLGTPSVTPLDDITYRRLLLVKAFCSNRDSADLSLAYYVTSLLLGRVPSVFELVDIDTVYYDLIINGNFDTDISDWVDGTTGTGSDLSWQTGKLQVIPPFGENGYAEQAIQCVRGATYTFTFDYDSEAGSQCRVLLGTQVDVNRYYTNFGQSGSGTTTVTFTPDLDELVYVRLGSIEQGTWSQFDNISVVRNNPVVQTRQVELVISQADTSAREEALINYAAKYFVPAGITFETSRI